MSGKDYYGMLEAFRLVENAVFCLLWESFESWALDNFQDVDDLSSLASHMSRLCEAVNDRNGDDAREAFNDMEADLRSVREKLDIFHSGQSHFIHKQVVAYVPGHDEDFGGLYLLGTSW